jgi:hypothetical protein
LALEQSDSRIIVTEEKYSAFSRDFSYLKMLFT